MRSSQGDMLYSSSPIQSDVRSCQGDVRYSYAHKFVMCGDVRFSGIPVSRRSREVPTSRLGLVSRKTVNVSVSGGRRLGLGQLRLVPKTNFRPNCAGHINKTYAQCERVLDARRSEALTFSYQYLLSLNLAIIIFVNFAVFVLILTSKLPVPSPLLLFILNLTAATHCTIIFHSLR